MPITRSGHQVPAISRRRPRVVGVIRLSRLTDATTSLDVQEEMIDATCSRLGGEFVGWAPDIDVSALKTTPWDREKLRYWLHRPDEWDVMIWQRMDRAVRSMADMADLGRYAKQHGKRLVFASGPGGAQLELDFSSPMSELVMLILAFAAQLEGQTIMERNQGAAAHLPSLGRWPGGPVPYGFPPVRRMFSDDNEGWWLGEHEETASYRRKAAACAIAGQTYSEITRWLITAEAPTPKNHRARLADPPRPGDPESTWQVTVVRDMLMSPLMRGHLVKKDGTTVRSADGSPVLQGEALIDDDTWHELKDALALLANGNSGPRRKDGHPLLGVVKCGICEVNMFASWYVEKVGRKGPRNGARNETFRCHGKQHTKGVPAVSILASGVLEYVEEQFLAHMGPFRRTQVVRAPGVDNRSEIAGLEADVEELSTRLAQLRGPAADSVMTQLQGRSDRLEELRKTPFTPAREEVRRDKTRWRSRYIRRPLYKVTA
ncbi:recombinase family protein [Streptomyces sp. H10-C2]|uniref:recombinase family protein n=1 Tax=unclassified Streptomyces TaxID=2593676 RepID=UPI0024BAB5FE|nr:MULTISPECIES: recombinase family protein [unclassified Streptomyces]MDJ0342949.1 recombinase family protein [Streptomyces sp. PH10-H1]MDJ0371489.1 recombinase family protein [Streptomyces sp. H10-C2]